MPRLASKMLSAVLVLAALAGFAMVYPGSRTHVGRVWVLAGALAVIVCAYLTLQDWRRRRR